MDNDKKFLCNWLGCTKRFKRSSHLKNHLRVHDGQKPFACDVKGCVATFSQSGNLKRHGVVHTKIKEKKYVCNWPECGKRTRDGHGLIKHQQSHARNPAPENIDEDFRDIPGLPGYQVSDHGRVRNSKTCKILSSYLSSGYKVLSLRKTQYASLRKTQYAVHRLVMLAFVGPPPSKQTVDHVDRNRCNNTLSNLRYSTAQEQAQNRSTPVIYKSTQRVERVDATGIVSYESAAVAAKDVNGITTHIYRAIRCGGKHKGFRWRRPVMVTDTTIWKDIPPVLINGQNGYAASEDGSIKFPNGRITNGCLLDNGYLRVKIARKGFAVHRLVAGTFYQQSATNQNLINHKDGNKSNNNMRNLEYVTPAENNKHARLHGLIVSKSQSVDQYSLEGKFIAKFSSACEAAEVLGKGRGHLQACCSGSKTSAHGFIWKYSKAESTDVAALTA